MTTTTRITVDGKEHAVSYDLLCHYSGWFKTVLVDCQDKSQPLSELVQTAWNSARISPDETIDALFQTLHEGKVNPGVSYRVLSYFSSREKPVGFGDDRLPFR